MKKIFNKVDYTKYYKSISPYLKSQKHHDYAMIIFSLFATIFFALFAISPTLSTIAKLKRDVQDSKIVDQKLTQKINNLSALSNAYQQIQPDIPYVLNAVPNTPEAPTFLAQIQAVANASNVTVSGLNISPVSLSSDTATQSSTITFQFSSKGKYSDVSKFLKSFTNFQRVVSINSISINSGNDGVEALVNGQAYYQAQ